MSEAGCDECGCVVIVIAFESDDLRGYIGARIVAGAQLAGAVFPPAFERSGDELSTGVALAAHGDELGRVVIIVAFQTNDLNRYVATRVVAITELACRVVSPAFEWP